jgi:aminoglycoside phosphotransferase (APT) family kinase protein
MAATDQAAKPPVRREIPPETVDVRPAHRFETDKLEKLFSEKLGARLADIKQMGGGQSNPTFVLYTDKGEFVLRKQPPGQLLPSAHAVDREYRVLSALSQTDVPVPKTYFFCDDRDVIGTPFYVMERMRGRVFWQSTLPEVPKEDRRATYFGEIDALARLHKVDYNAIGLGDYGKPGGYFERQIGRWSKQWEKSRTRDNPSIDKLAEWLPGNIPAGSDETVICHGDFRFDNMMFHPTEPRVIAIFDWELSTLGHPMADLAYTCIRHSMPPDISDGLAGLDLNALGLPSQQELIDHYSERVGKPARFEPFHTAFSLFRLAVILEGVVARALAGNASNSTALQSAPVGIALADLGWQIAIGQREL